MSKHPQPKCPECEKLSAVAQTSNEIGNFLGWMIENTDYRVCFFTKSPDQYIPSSHSQRESLLAQYFDINLNKVEKERQKLLEWLRQEQS